MSLRLWLLGTGVAASPSPAMQTAAMRAAGIAGSYRALETTPAELRGRIARLRAGEADGANVTIPHKLLAARLCDRLEGDAALLGCVNTLVREGGELIGANTDAAGLDASLRAQALRPAPGARVAVIGAGGAALAAGLALARTRPARLDIVARRVEAALAAAERMPAEIEAGAVALGDRRTPVLLDAADVLVNATPVGLEGLPLVPERLGRRAVVIDLRYRPRPVDLVAAARAAGLRGCDGVEMLLHQGMLSLRRWAGVDPGLGAARAALVEALAGSAGEPAGR